MCVGLQVNYPLFFSDYKETLIFSTEFTKIIKFQISFKTRPVGTKLFHADGETDMTNLTVAFCNFANAPKKKN